MSRLAGRVGGAVRRGRVALLTVCALLSIATVASLASGSDPQPSLPAPTGGVSDAAIQAADQEYARQLAFQDA